VDGGEGKGGDRIPAEGDGEGKDVPGDDTGIPIWKVGELRRTSAKTDSLDDEDRYGWVHECIHDALSGLDRREREIKEHMDAMSKGADPGASEIDMTTLRLLQEMFESHATRLEMSTQRAIGGATEDLHGALADDIGTLTGQMNEILAIQRRERRGGGRAPPVGVQPALPRGESKDDGRGGAGGADAKDTTREEEPLSLVGAIP
jgi:hypothetical protein